MLKPEQQFPAFMNNDSCNCILVVDDTPENRRLYSLILRQAGCEVTEAAREAGAAFWFTLG